MKYMTRNIIHSSSLSGLSVRRKSGKFHDYELRSGAFSEAS